MQCLLEAVSVRREKNKNGKEVGEKQRDGKKTDSLICTSMAKILASLVNTVPDSGGTNHLKIQK